MIQHCITFAAFKRIVQRLKMELLFLPELHNLQGFYTDSRCCTPIHFAEENGSQQKSGFSAERPLINNDTPMVSTGMVEPIIPSLSINFTQNAGGQPHYGTIVSGLTVEETRGEQAVKFSSVDYNQKR